MHEDLGKYFIKEGVIYHCIGCIDNPAIIVENITTKERNTVVIGSNEYNEYGKLYYEPCSDSNMVLPVENINDPDKE